MSYHEWTTDELESLRQMARDGLTQLEAAHKLGFRVTQVQSVCQRNGIPWAKYPRWTDADISRLGYLASRGATMHEAGDELGRTSVAVMVRARQCGIKFVKRGAPAAHTRELSPHQERIVRMVACGLADAEIAARVGESPKHIRGQLTAIFNKTGSHNRVRLALWVLREGLATVDEAWAG